MKFVVVAAAVALLASAAVAWAMVAIQRLGELIDD